MVNDHWTEEDFKAVKAFKKSIEKNVESIGFKSPQDFIKSLGKVANRSS